MTSNEELRDFLLHHAHNVEKFNTFEVKKVLTLLRQAERETRRKIGEFTEDTSEMKQVVYNRFLKSVIDLQKIYGGKIQETLTKDMKSFAQTEVELNMSYIMKTTTGEVLQKMDMILKEPSPAQLWTAATVNPLTFDGTSTMLEPLIGSITDKMTTAVEKSLTYSYAIQETTRDAMKRLYGTGTAEGTFKEAKNWLEAVTRTSLNHMANEAKNKLYEDNSDIVQGYQIVATLDTRTTPICQYYDGRVWYYDEKKRARTSEKLLPGPITPPFHIRCRTATIPLLSSWRELGVPIDELDSGQRASMNGQVPADQTYLEWMQKQPQYVQRDVLGVARFEAMKAGKIKVDSFYDKDGSFLTLDQLKQKGYDIKRN